MASSDSVFEGRCLCGAVKVSAVGPPLLTLACHCDGCQKLCASAFSLTTMFRADGFSCSGDVIIGGLGTEGRAHYFCKSCLNFIYSQIGGADHRVNLRTSVLDRSAELVPSVEVMTDEKLPWVNIPVEHSFARFPESAEALQALLDTGKEQ